MGRVPNSPELTTIPDSMAWNFILSFVPFEERQKEKNKVASVSETSPAGALHLLSLPAWLSLLLLFATDTAMVGFSQLDTKLDVFGRGTLNWGTASTRLFCGQVWGRGEGIFLIDD